MTKNPGKHHRNTIMFLYLDIADKALQFSVDKFKELYSGADGIGIFWCGDKSEKYGCDLFRTNQMNYKVFSFKFWYVPYVYFPTGSKLPDDFLILLANKKHVINYLL